MSKRGRTSRGGQRGPRGQSRSGQQGGPSKPVGGEVKGGIRSARGRQTVIILLIFVGAAIPFGLGKYFEFYTPDPFDSSGFVYSAQRVLQGAEIGIEEKPSAQIGTLLVNMLGVKLFGYSEIGPKFIQMVLQGGALVLMFLALRRLFGIWAAGVGVMVAAVYLSAPFIAKFGNVKEQYMIACMVMAVSFLIFHQLGGGRWWWAVLAGMGMIWAPMFKQTGLSVFGAIGLFMVLQPLLKNRSWKHTGLDVLWIWVGIFVGLAPALFWKKAAEARGMELPYEFVWRVLTKAEAPTGDGPVMAWAVGMNQSGESENENPAPNPGESGQTPEDQPTGYVGASRALSSLGIQAKVVFRFYRLLILPISLAVGSIIFRLVRLVRGRGKPKACIYDRFVLLLALWWLIDMAFGWISPRSYEQYYLPLTASAAMLGGYLIGLWQEKVTLKPERGKWVWAGVVGVVVMILMVWPIIFGITRSPHHGGIYTNASGEPEKRNGYVQKLKEVRDRIKGVRKPSWEVVAEMIKGRSVETDKVYVWGWFPGILVKSQRISPTKEAVYGNMHSDPPATVGREIGGILEQLKAEPPKFIVDTQKLHYPYYDHPNFDLWPRGIGPEGQRRYIPAEDLGRQRESLLQLAEDQSFMMMRASTHPNGPIPEDRARQWARLEKARHAAMFPLREFVMQNYEPILPADAAMFIFQRKDALKR